MLSRRSLHGLAIAAALGALLLPGCGGGNDDASSPLDEALGYLPEDAGFVLIASTDTGDYSDVSDLLGKFPFGGRVEDALKQSLESQGLDFDDDVKPLLGNELVIGTDDNASFVDSSQDTPVILALETRDGNKLRDIAKKDAESQGNAEGYDLYQDRDTWLAIKDDVVVLTNDEDRLKRALEQRGQDDRLTEDDVDPAFEGLPDDAPVDAYVNLHELLAADPGTKDALKVKWVESLETLGLTFDVADDGVSVDYFARTDPDGLSDDDLPLAGGNETPQVLERDSDNAEVVLGLRDPSQVIDFALAAIKGARPADYAQFQAGKEAAGRRLGIDIDDDVLAQLTGDASAAVTLDGQFGARAELDDAAAFKKTLAKIMGRLPEFADGVTVTPPKKGDRFYGVAAADGKTYAVGVAGDALVVANDAKLASEVATRDLVDADGEGAFVANADAEKLANAALAEFAGGLQGLGGSLFTGPLGELLLTAAASTDGVRGRLHLEVD